MSTGTNDLSRRRSGKAQFARHAINAARLGELRFGEAKLAILFPQLIAHLFLGFNAVRAFDGAEVLHSE
jgi:hypothetical protein